MFLRDLLPRYPFWLPQGESPIYPQSPRDLQRLFGWSRQYCWMILAGQVPPKALASTLILANARAKPSERLPLDDFLACDPREWPEQAKKRNRLSYQRLRQRLRQLEAQVQAAEGGRSPPKSKGIG